MTHDYSPDEEAYLADAAGDRRMEALNQAAVDGALDLPIHLLIDKPITEKQLAAIRLFAHLILSKGYTPSMLGDIMLAMPSAAMRRTSTTEAGTE